MGLLLLIGVAIVLIEVYAPRPEADSVLGGNLSDVTKKAIDLTVDLSKLFMTWSLALMAGAAIYLKTSLESGSPLTRTNLRLLEAIIVVCILSVFFGQAVITRVTNLLLLDVFPVDDVVWHRFQAAQYFAFLLSLLLVAVFIDLAYSRPIERRTGDTTDGG